MSKYTTELRFICENSAGLTESVGYNSVDSVLDKCRDKIFDFDFPIFDESYRVPLENKILKHYYTREIGAETVGLWKYWLNVKLNEIMPYYNQLYKSTLIEFNPMYDVDLTTDYQKVDNGNKNTTGSFSETGNKADTFSETGTKSGSVHEVGNTEESGSTSGTTSGNKTDTDGGKNDHWEYFSETPEGGINGVADLRYLTTALHTTDDRTGSVLTSAITTNNSGSNSKDIDKTNDTTTSDNYSKSSNGSDEYSKSGSNQGDEVIRNIEDYLHHVVGKKGGTSYSKMLDEYRKTFLNIDMKVINDLQDLFLNLW